MNYRTAVKAFLLFLLVAVLLWIHRNWVFTTAPLVSGDWPYFESSQLKEWLPSHSLWINYESLGRTVVQTNFLLLFFIYGVLGGIGFDFSIISRLLFFWPILVLAPVFCMKFLVGVTRSYLAAICGTSIYVLNSYFLVIQGGHLHLSMVYALFPLLLHIASVRSKNNAWFAGALLYGLTLFVMSVYDVRVTIAAHVVGLGVYTISHKSIRDSLKKVVLFALVSTVEWIILCSFWILPKLMTEPGKLDKNPFSTPPLNWQNLSDGITLHHPFWSARGVEDFVFHDPPTYYFLLPLVIIVFIATTVRHKFYGKLTLFFTALCLGSLVMLAQSNSPFGDAYNVLYDSFGAMAAYRDGSKFFLVVAICFAALAAVGIARIEKTHEKTAYSTAVLVVGILVAMASPYLLTSPVKTFRAAKPSAELEEINEKISDSESQYNRNLWVSRTPKFVRSDYRNVNLDSLQVGSTFFKDFKQNGNVTTYVRHALPSFVNLLSIRNIIVPEDNIETGYMHYNFRDSEYYKQLVQNYPDMVFEEIGGSLIARNPSPKDYIYTSNEIVYVDGDLQDFSGIDKNKYSAYLFRDDLSDRDMVEGYFDIVEIHPFSVDKIVVKEGKIEGRIDEGFNDLRNIDLYRRDAPFDQYKRSVLDRAIVEIEDNRITGENIVANGSFEQALPRIGDCNNYDDTSLEKNRIRGSVTVDASDGSQALQIEAGRHTACFSLALDDFNAASNYLVEFDYKTISGDPPEVGLSPYVIEPFRRIDLLEKSNSTWTTYRKLFVSDDFSNDMNLVVYLPTEDGENSVARFDRFRVYELPDLPQVYLRAKSKNKNREISPLTEYDNVSPSRKKVKMRNAESVQLLVLSESFHPQWDVKIGGFVMDRADHLVVNGFANGWLIDVDKVCNKEGLCTSNNDGTWDIDLIIEFTPQRWLYIGSAISGVTFVGVVSYIGYDHYRVRKKRVIKLG